MPLIKLNTPAEIAAAIRVVVADEPEKNSSGGLIVAKLAEIQQEEKCDRERAIELLASKGREYGQWAGQMGGVNAYMDDNENIELEFTTSDESHWMTLGMLIDTEIGAGLVSDWFDYDRYAIVRA